MTRSIQAGLLAVGALAVTAVNAAVPESVTTEMTAYKTDGLAIIALIMGAGIALWAGKKIGQKFGWL